MTVSSDPRRPHEQDARWTDGLRGIVAMLVMLSHIIRAFAPIIDEASMSADSGPIFWQLPFIRLVGAHWIAIFFVLLGYVNVISPIKRARQGDVAGALTALASSATRRLIRLVLPTIIASLGSFIICQCGGYTLAKKSDSAWIEYTSPERATSMPQAIKMLAWNLWTMWTRGANAYDPNHWTMFYLLKSSFFLYMVLLVTLRATSKSRMLVFALSYAYCWGNADVTTGINICAGALFAEWNLTMAPIRLPDSQPSSPLRSEKRSDSYSSPFSTNSICRNIPGLSRATLPYLLFPIALFLCGYPDSNPEWTSWSSLLSRIGRTVTPGNTELWRLYPSLGAQIIIITIILSPTLQYCLIRPLFLWLGKLSFPIYLIHGSLLRSALVWMVYAFGTVRQEIVVAADGTQGIVRTVAVAPTNVWVYVLVVPVWTAGVLVAAQVWNRYVEAWCVWVTGRLEEITMAPLI